VLWETPRGRADCEVEQAAFVQLDALAYAAGSPILVTCALCSRLVISTEGAIRSA
jgi:hypothetical protein